MQKRIGIVGFGIVGKSALRFLQSRVSAQFFIWDKRNLSPEELLMLNDATVASEIPLEQFLQQVDEVVISPGVDVRAYVAGKHKFISELDLFASAFEKKIIGITGTLGKTTVTRLISTLLPYKNTVGGNIGQGMLDLINEPIDWIVLEISSFQLEYNKVFAPDVAVWTNFYPNHLDRHTTLKDYFDAKWMLFAHQKPAQCGILPVELLVGETGEWLQAGLQKYQGDVSFISYVPVELGLLEGRKLLFVEHNIFCKGRVVRGQLVEVYKIFDLSAIPEKSYIQNWLLAIAVMDALQVPVEKIRKTVQEQELVVDKHRLELFATVSGVDFYNDSKATVMQATQAAITKLAQSKRPIILVVGGLGKGVDRTPLVKFISQVPEIKKVFYLGKGAPEFSHYEQFSSLHELVHAILHTMAEGDQVLFSPSGTSFDLFSNYEERGTAFKQAVQRVSNEEKHLKT